MIHMGDVSPSFSYSYSLPLRLIFLKGDRNFLSTSAYSCLFFSPLSVGSPVYFLIRLSSKIKSKKHTRYGTLSTF